MNNWRKGIHDHTNKTCQWTSLEAILSDINIIRQFMNSVIAVHKLKVIKQMSHPTRRYQQLKLQARYCFQRGLICSDRRAAPSPQ